MNNKLQYSDDCPRGEWQCYNSDGSSSCLDCNTSVFGTCMDDPWISCAGRHPGTSRNPPGDPNSGCNTGWYPCYDQSTGKPYCKACTNVAAGSGYCQQSQTDVCGGEACPPGQHFVPCSSPDPNDPTCGCV